MKITQNLAQPVQPPVESYNIEVTPQQLVELRIVIGNLIGGGTLPSLYSEIRKITDQRDSFHTSALLDLTSDLPKLNLDGDRELYDILLTNAKKGI